MAARQNGELLGLSGPDDGHAEIEQIKWQQDEIERLRKQAQDDRELATADVQTERNVARILREQVREQQDELETVHEAWRIAVIECTKALEQVRVLREAIAFYADPATYFAIGFFPDDPAGDFIHDFSETDLGVKPGLKARDALARTEPPTEGVSGLP